MDMIKFEKLQGTGNDFIIFKEEEVKNLELKKLAAKVCNRRFGIGADGMMLVSNSEIADIKMDFYNADGSIATMCGNGIRCFSKFVYDNQILTKTKFEVETLAGIMKVEIKLKDDKAELVKVNLGRPKFIAKEIPENSEDQRVFEREIKVDGQILKINSLVIGTIHTVIMVDEFENLDLEKIGKKLEYHPLFPMKTNVNFCKIIDDENIEVLTWEKGVGMTLACGTGVAASSIVSRMLYECSDTINVKVKGGNLKIEEMNEEIFMTGSAKLICKGSYNIDNY